MKLYPVFVLLLLMWSCGVQDYQDPTLPGGEVSKDVFTTTIKPILSKSCSGTGCHSSSVDEFLNNGEAFTASGAGPRLESNNMPIPGSAQAKAFTPNDKAVLLNYLSGK